MRRPDPSEHAPYYSRYTELVPEIDIVHALESAELQKLLGGVSEEKASFRYAPDKWSIKQLVGHVADCERVFQYRLLAIARGEQQPLPGFEQDEWMAASNFDSIPLRDLADGLDAARRTTLSIVRGLSPEAWDRRGVASDNAVSVRALAYITLGHERHHMNILRERYL